MVVDRYGEDPFGVILTDHIFIEDLFDFCGLGDDQFGNGIALLFLKLFRLFCGDMEITVFQAVFANAETFVSTGKNLFVFLISAGPAEGTNKGFSVVCHRNYFLSPGLLTTLSTRP